MEATLFKDEPQPPLSISFDGYAVAFNAKDWLPKHKPQWELDTDTICKTREAVAQLMHEWADTGEWKIVKVRIVAEELSPFPSLPTTN